MSELTELITLVRETRDSTVANGRDICNIKETFASHKEEHTAINKKLDDLSSAVSEANGARRLGKWVAGIMVTTAGALGAFLSRGA